MVQALAENCVAIKYAGLVAENVDTTVSNIIYNAIYDYTGETFAMNEYSLLDGQTSEITVDVDIPKDSLKGSLPNGSPGKRLHRKRRDSRPT